MDVDVVKVLTHENGDNECSNCNSIFTMMPLGSVTKEDGSPLADDAKCPACNMPWTAFEEAEPPVSMTSYQSNRIVAHVTASVTGLSMKKGQESSHKEIKLLSGDLTNLRELEGYFGRQVEVVFLIEEDLFTAHSDSPKPESEDGESDSDTDEEGQSDAGAPENEGTQEDGQASDTTPPTEPEFETPAPVDEPPIECPKCKSTMMPNPADEAMLICASETCGHAVANPAFEEPEID